MASTGPVSCRCYQSWVTTVPDINIPWNLKASDDGV
jgi:hypothetical protein